MFRVGLPFVKVGPNDYLIGGKNKKVTVTRGQPQVKHENSYVGLEEYLHRQSKAEFIEILQKMQRTECSLHEAIEDLLERYGAQRFAKQNFLKDLDLLERPFEELKQWLC